MDESQKDDLIGEFISQWGFTSEAENAEFKQDLLALIGKLIGLCAAATHEEPEPMSLDGRRRITLTDED
jgi:hypothetical protein